MNNLDNINYQDPAVRVALAMRDTSSAVRDMRVIFRNHPKEALESRMWLAEIVAEFTACMEDLAKAENNG